MEVILKVGTPRRRDAEFAFSLIEELRIAGQLDCPHLMDVTRDVLRGEDNSGDLKIERGCDRFGLEIMLWREDAADMLILFLLAHHGAWETGYGSLLKEPIDVLQQAVEDGAEQLTCFNLTVVIQD